MLIHFCISTFFFFISLYFWWVNQIPFELKGNSIKSKLTNALSSPPFILEIVLFILGIFISILLLATIANVISSNLNILLKKTSHIFCHIFSWLIVILLILGMSSYEYPELFYSHNVWSQLKVLVPTSLLAFFFITYSFIIKKNRVKASLILLPIISLFIPSLGIYKPQTQFKHKNVVIIGIDSLNVRLINKKNTPFIESFVSSSIHLPNSYTHVARTFPSWVSVLTGNYPLTNHARLNLTSFDKLDLKENLAYDLKEAGYKTYFSLDERRFSHIDQRLYFDNIIGPPATAGEFLFSKLADLPLLVLTSKLPFFELLMPHIHNNRAVWSTYSPEKFNLKLEREIHNTGLPVFIASHFTLPHWPYKIKNNDNSRSSYDKYFHSVQLVDKQVERFIAHLNNEGLLDNSLIFLITDHGESFGRKIDLPKNSSNFTNTAGHGTTIISSSQFKVLFSFKEYEGGTLVNHTAPNKELNYALTDIAPTIIDLLDIDNKRDSDGTSIFKVQQQRPIPLESSLKPMFNKQGEIDEEKTVKQTANLFEVDSLGKVVFNNQLYHEVVKSKQRGVIKGKWQLSVFPEHNNNIYITNLHKDILYNQQALNNEELIAELRKSFCHLFSSEIDEAEINLCRSATQKTDSFGR
ncbi:Sulfatase [Pseudoalteromonas sp. P1-30]|nr:Sulfatase [Pseudoalteromonas sp. P1-30]